MCLAHQAIVICEFWRKLNKVSIIKPVLLLSWNQFNFRDFHGNFCVQHLFEKLQYANFQENWDFFLLIQFYFKIDWLTGISAETFVFSILENELLCSMKWYFHFLKKPQSCTRCSIRSKCSLNLFGGIRGYAFLNSLLSQNKGHPNVPIDLNFISPLFGVLVMILQRSLNHSWLPPTVEE